MKEEKIYWLLSGAGDFVLRIFTKHIFSFQPSTAHTFVVYDSQ
jgi:hypothetical protein